MTLEVFAVPYLPQSEPPNSFRLQVCLVEIVSSLLKGQLDPSRLSDASIRFPMHPDHYKVSNRHPTNGELPTPLMLLKLKAF